MKKFTIASLIVLASLIVGCNAKVEEQVEPVTQEQKQEEQVKEQPSETKKETVEPSVVDVEVKPIKEDAKIVQKETPKQEVVKPNAKEEVKEEPKVEVAEEVEEVETTTDLDQAKMIVENAMQNYGGNYSVVIEDIGIMVLLEIQEFDISVQYDALDVDQAMNKALRVNGCEDVPTATIVSDVNTNEVYLTVVNGQIR